MVTSYRPLRQPSGTTKLWTLGQPQPSEAHFSGTGKSAPGSEDSASTSSRTYTRPQRSHAHTLRKREGGRVRGWEGGRESTIPIRSTTMAKFSAEVFT